MEQLRKRAVMKVGSVCSILYAYIEKHVFSHKTLPLGVYISRRKPPKSRKSIVVAFTSVLEARVGGVLQTGAHSGTEGGVVAVQRPR